MATENPTSRTPLFRPAVEGDVPAILDIETRSFAQPGERFEHRRIRHLTRHPRILVTVVEEAGNLLGWVAGFVWLRGKTPWGRVYAIAVDPKARGRKLGRGLMENMIDALEARGASRIFLEVRPDNDAALRLYQRLRFSECARLPNFYGPRLPAVRMVRVRT